MKIDDLKLLLEHLELGIALYDMGNANYIWANRKEHLLRGYDEKALSKKSLYDAYASHDVSTLKSLFNQCAKANHGYTEDFHYTENSRYFCLRMVRHSDTMIMTTLSDITELSNLKKHRFENEATIKCLDDAVNGANIGCWDFYPQQSRILANKTWVTQKGLPLDEFRDGDGIFSEIKGGMDRWITLVHPDDLAKTQALIQRHLDGETPFYDATFRMKFGDEQWHWIHDLGRVFERDRHGKALRMNGVHIDVTQAKNLALEIARVSTTDPLTGLLNRRRFEDILCNTIKESMRYQHLVCFLIMDIDYFKQYNDTYGHFSGDEALIAIGRSLQANVQRFDDYCFRLGGEEFAVVFKAKDEQHAIAYSQRLRRDIEALCIQHEKSEVSQYLTVSMGLICGRYDSCVDIDRIYKETDALLYNAKRAGRNTLCWRNL